LAALAGPGAFAQDRVDLGAIGTPEDPPQAAAAGLPLHLYTDFDVDLTVANDPAQEPSLVFAQNHREILIQSLPDSPLLLEGDLLAPGNFFDVGVPLSLPFPALGGSWLGSSVLRAGILLLPFGEFQYHHLYGGREDNAGRFLDRVWSDLGIQWTASPWEGSTLDLYSTNGIRSTAAGPSWGPQQAGSDNNRQKSVGFRWRQDLAPGWLVGISAYRDPWGPDQEPSKVAQMGGLDLAARWAALSARFGGALGWVTGPNLDYLRWGWYGEGRWDLTSAWAVRVRGGTLVADSRTPTVYGNRGDANASLLWRTGPVEWDADVFFDGPVVPDEAFIGKDSSWEFLLKILFTL
jgi:hypothetical protein